MPKQQRKRNNKQRRGNVPRTLRPSPNVHLFERTVSQVMPVNQAFGFNSSGFNLAIAWSLSTMTIFCNGAGLYTPAVPSYSEFSALFDQYQIRGVELEIFWSKNIAGESSPYFSVPLLWSVEDYDDLASTPVDGLQQYPKVKATSLGEDGGKILRHSMKPTPKASVVNTTSGTASAPVSDPNMWIDCSYPDVYHYGLKFCLDTFGRSTNYDMGSLLFVAKVHYAFRNAR